MKMINTRVWIGVAFGAIIMSVLAFCLATPGADTVNARAEPESAKPAQSSALPPQNYEGMLTDTHCGAKHSAAVGMSAADCTGLVSTVENTSLWSMARKPIFSKATKPP